MMKGAMIVIYVFICLGYCQGFVVQPWKTSSLQTKFRISSSTTDLAVAYGLTPVLAQYAETFRSVPDDKLRYQQLLYLAQMANPMDASLKVDENKVPGCLSTVHVHATWAEDGKIYFVGDADSQLTKGLVTLLVNGLSGSTAESIVSVKPEFVQYAGIAKSLTPGRNNGFLNMLHLMKVKARRLAQQKGISLGSTASASAGQTSAPSDQTTTPATGGRPIYDSVVKKLSMLRPTLLEVEDESYKHAGHSGVAGMKGGETHFNVKIVASCFEGLSLVQRHKMIYTLLTQEMNNCIHALSIIAKAPSEPL